MIVCIVGLGTTYQQNIIQDKYILYLYIIYFGRLGTDQDQQEDSQLSNFVFFFSSFCVIFDCWLGLKIEQNKTDETKTEGYYPYKNFISS